MYLFLLGVLRWYDAKAAFQHSVDLQYEQRQVQLQSATTVVPAICRRSSLQQSQQAKGLVTTGAQQDLYTIKANVLINKKGTSIINRFPANTIEKPTSPTLKGFNDD